MRLRQVRRGPGHRAHFSQRALPVPRSGKPERPNRTPSDRCRACNTMGWNTQRHRLRHVPHRAANRKRKAAAGVSGLIPHCGGRNTGTHGPDEVPRHSTTPPGSGGSQAVLSVGVAWPTRAHTRPTHLWTRKTGADKRHLPDPYARVPDGNGTLKVPSGRRGVRMKKSMRGCMWTPHRPPRRDRLWRRMAGGCKGKFAGWSRYCPSRTVTIMPTSTNIDPTIQRNWVACPLAISATPFATSV